MRENELNVLKQIELGKLACPVTKMKLAFSETKDSLVSEDGRAYPLLNGKTPVLLTDQETMDTYVKESEKMNEEYGEGRKTLGTLLMEIERKLVPDFRNKSSIEGFNRVVASLPDDKLCLSIGGGPRREHPNLTTLNVAPFPNVDVVADAHVLPYVDNSVDAIYCEAVIEHLSDPVKAVKEMCRVLKKGGEAFVVTPFLQAYHGYPHHYQNLTVTGHKHLFSSQGFNVLEAGTCVGPAYTVVNIISKFIKYYFPSLISLPLLIVWNLLGLLVRPLDILLNNREDSHFLASTTYLLARKD